MALVLKKSYALVGSGVTNDTPLGQTITGYSWIAEKKNSSGWATASGADVQLTNATQSNATFTALLAGTYRVLFHVTDSGSPGTGSDNVSPDQITPGVTGARTLPTYIEISP